MNAKKNIALLISLCLLGLLLSLVLLPGIYMGEKEQPTRIGSVLSLSGPAAMIGNELQEGQRLGIRYLHDVMKRMVSVEWQDSKSTPKDGLAAHAAMHAKGINLFTANLSGVALALKPEVASGGSVMLAIASHPGITNPALPGVFLFSQTAAQEAKIITDALLQASPTGPYAIFYSGDDYGQAFFTIANRIIGLAGQTAQGVPFKPEDGPVMRTLVQQALTKKPQGIIVAGAGAPMTQVIQYLRESGYQGQIVANIGFALTGVKQTLGAAAGNVRYTELDIPVTTDAANWAANAYKERHSKTLTPEALIGFYSILILAEAADAEGAASVISARIPGIARREVSGASVAPNEIAIAVRLVNP